MKFEVRPPGAITTTDITERVANVTISDNIDSLGAHLTFESISSNYDANLRFEPLPVGTLVIFNRISGYSYAEHLERNRAAPTGVDALAHPWLFVGIIVSRTFDNSDKWVYEAYDYGFYLNKSMINIQFNGVNATAAIEQICLKQNIKKGLICDIPTKIRKIYHANVVIDVIRDILEQAELDQGVKYRLEMANGTHFCVAKCDDLTVNMTAVPVNNGDVVRPGSRPLELKYTTSMADMKTQVTIVGGTERYSTTYAVATKDLSESESKRLNANYNPPPVYKTTRNVYGLINEVIRVDGKDRSQLTQMAKKRLEDVGKLGISFTVKLIGDYRVRSGRFVNFIPVDKFSLTGKYLVTSSTHKYYNNRYHVMELELRPVGPADEEVNPYA